MATKIIDSITTMGWWLFGAVMGRFSTVWPRFCPISGGIIPSAVAVAAAHHDPQRATDDVFDCVTKNKHHPMTP